MTRAGRRSLVAGLLALALLAGVVVGADRLAAWGAERAVVRSVVAEGVDVVGADVDIHGFPFLTQLAAGRLTHVTGRLQAGTFAGYQVSDVRFEAWGVEPRDPYRAERATVQGLLEPSALDPVLSDQLGREVTVATAPQDPEALLVSTSFLGIDVGVLVEPSVVDGTTLGVSVRSAILAGVTVDVEDLPGGLADRLGALTVPLDLPDGVTLRQVAVEAGAVRLAADGHDVALAGLSG